MDAYDINVSWELNEPVVRLADLETLGETETVSLQLCAVKLSLVMYVSRMALLSVIFYSSCRFIP